MGVFCLSCHQFCKKSKWKIVCKTDQLHFRILWIVLRTFLGKTNFKLEISYLYHALPNAFWKLQSWGCFNAGLVYCARAICQSMYQIAINMSRYKYKLSQFTHHITVLLMLWHILRIKSPWNLLKLQSSKCKCNLKIDVTTRLEAKTFLATDFSPSYPFFEGHLISEYMIPGKTCPKNNEKMFSQQVALRR